MGFNYTRDEVMQMSMNSKARKLDEIERRLAVVEKKLASDVRENKRGEWIPCSERPPEEEGQYLVTLDFAWGKEIEMGDWFIFEDGHGEWVNPNSHVTVAWMELPTPWKSEVE